MLPPV